MILKFKVPTLDIEIKIYNFLELGFKVSLVLQDRCFQRGVMKRKNEDDNNFNVYWSPLYQVILWIMTCTVSDFKRAEKWLNSMKVTYVRNI